MDNKNELIDQQRNTPLHYAVAERDYPPIWRLVQSKEIDLMAKNNNGETAADWFRPYRNQLKISEQLDWLPQKIEQGDTAFIEHLVDRNIDWSVRYKGGDTPLHLAFKYKQYTIAEKIASTNLQLLYSKNGKGQTPIDMAPAKGEAEAIIQSLKDGQPTLTNAHCISSQSASPDLIPTIDKSKLVELTKKLEQQAKINDYTPLHPFLTTLCQLGQITCQKALALLKAISIQPTEENKLKQVKELLRKLLGNQYDLQKIEQKITDIYNHLNIISNCPSIEQHITFSTEKKIALGWSIDSERKIYLNPSIEKTNTTTLTTTLIHETSHLANRSYDFSYTFYCFPNKGGTTLNFNDCYLLAKNGNYKETSVAEKKLVILATQEILERKIETSLSLEEGHEGQNKIFYKPQLDNYTWLSYNNADTLTTIIMGLAAIHTGHAEIKHNHRLFINKGFPFSCNLLACQPQNSDASFFESSGEFDNKPRKIIKARRKKITQQLETLTLNNSDNNSDFSVEKKEPRSGKNLINAAKKIM